MHRSYPEIIFQAIGEKTQKLADACGVEITVDGANDDYTLYCKFTFADLPRLQEVLMCSDDMLMPKDYEIGKGAIKVRLDKLILDNGQPRLSQFVNHKLPVSMDALHEFLGATTDAQKQEIALIIS